MDKCTKNILVYPVNMQNCYLSIKEGRKEEKDGGREGGRGGQRKHFFS